jgi:hypothetical protein
MKMHDKSHIANKGRNGIVIHRDAQLAILSGDLYVVWLQGMHASRVKAPRNENAYCRNIPATTGGNSI